MEKIIIMPTLETSWGIADSYDIKSDETNKILYENVSQESLMDIIEKNKYKVVDGEKYL